MARQGEWMSVWRLTPVDRDNPAWQASETTMPVLARAPNPTVARFEAACRLTRRHVSSVAASPWWRGDLVRVEQLEDPSLSRIGPTRVFGAVVRRDPTPSY
jgi:hypothetical protein